MRILVVGAGGTGGYYGGRLLQAGRDVTFLVRPARAALLRAEGLQIISPHGDLCLHPQLRTADALDTTFDIVLLGVKAPALDAAMNDMAPAVGPRTLIVPMLNGMRHIDLLANRFGSDAVLGGVSQIAVTVDERGRIIQLNDMHKLAYGARRSAGPVDPARLAALHASLGGAGFDARLSQEIDLEMWEKWVFLATLGGITCLLRGTIGDIEAVPGGAALARGLLAECASVAEAAGLAPRADHLARVEAAVTAPGSTLASSMYRDLQNGLEVEADQILGDLKQRAQRRGLTVPLLDAAYAHLCVYRAKRHGA